MISPVISVEHLTKQYDLGVIGTGTLSRDLNRWWARVRHLPDPYTRIGQQDAFARTRTRTAELLASYRPPQIPVEQKAALQEMVAALARSAGMDTLPALDVTGELTKA